MLAGLSLSLTAQELPLLTDKQGTFEILSRTDYVRLRLRIYKSRDNS